MNELDEASSPASEHESAVVAPKSPGPGGLASLILVLVGALMMAIGVIGPLREWVGRGFGTERLLALAVGFQFFYIALLLHEKNRLKARFRELLDHILQTFYGKNYRRERRAIDILIDALDGQDSGAQRAAAEHLQRLTGQSFGEDREAWLSWWKMHRATFRRVDLASGNDPHSTAPEGPA